MIQAPGEITPPLFRNNRYLSSIAQMDENKIQLQKWMVPWLYSMFVNELMQYLNIYSSIHGYIFKGKDSYFVYMYIYITLAVLKCCLKK